MRTEAVAAREASSLEHAAALIEAGEVVAIPTDTVYGLAVLAESEPAVARCFAVKDRPPDRPLPIFPASISAIGAVVELGPRGTRLAQCFWPGALTIVAPIARGFSSAATLGLPTAGVRLPSNEWVLALLARIGRPLAVTSANRSGAGSVSTAAEVRAGLDGRIPLIVDGGPAGGLESTIVDITKDQPAILRQGAISYVEVERCLDSVSR